MADGAEPDLDRIRELRQRGLTPKEIARALGLRPSQVTQVVRQLAAAETVDPLRRPVVECWVSPGWDDGLTVDGHPDWPRGTAPGEGASGLVGVVVARDAGRSRVSVCGWLVDVYCLGVKNDIGPEERHLSSMPEFLHGFFDVFGRRPVGAPLDLAQHLVLGAVEYARGLGFEPASESDFAETRGQLGPWEGPSAIGFGRNGKPFYVAGPYDDARRVIKRLEKSVGRGNFEFLLEMPG
jgi:hypothetical protein